MGDPTFPVRALAGLLAYLLSIYPSATFDPVFAKSSFPSMLTQEAFLIGGAPARLYTLICAVLPSVVAELMPTFRPLAAAARSDTLTPADLKAAVITLATRGALSGVASDTPNVLIFNNATSE
ncbi:hypothetical protein C8J57DRAFT_1644395 [Mycena rebaudengoi]|nr:hypothetical protein C8J57DRAFT_1644395 [Mycena rebaudengoi]